MMLIALLIIAIAILVIVILGITTSTSLILLFAATVISTMASLIVVGAVVALVILVLVVVAIGDDARWVLTSSAIPRVAPRPIMEHAFPVALQLYLDLPIDELQEAVLVHLVVKVIAIIGPFLEPGPWHLKLVLEVMARMQNGLLRWLGSKVRLRHLMVWLELLMLLLLEHLLLLGGVLLDQSYAHFACGCEQLLECVSAVFAHLGTSIVLAIQIVIEQAITVALQRYLHSFVARAALVRR